MFFCFYLCIKRYFFYRLPQPNLNQTYRLSLIICFSYLVMPVIVDANEIYSKKQISAELWELESEAVRNHASAFKIIEERLNEATHDKVRQAYLYLFRVGLLQHSSSAILEEQLSKALQLFDPDTDPELYLYSMAVKAFIMSKSPTQEQKASDLLENLQDHPELQRDVYIHVKFLTIQISIYYQLKKYEKITRPLVRMANTLNGRKIRQEIEYIQVNLNDALAQHSSLIGDIEQTKMYHRKQLVQTQNDGLSDDNSNVYCALANIYNLSLTEKIHYAKASLQANKNGFCAQLMKKMVLLGEIQQGKIEHMEELAQIIPSKITWQDEQSAYYAGLAFLHLNDSAMALSMAALINRDDSWEYHDLLQQSYQLQGDYQNAFIAAQRYQRLREQKDSDAKVWMINSYQTRLELAQEDILSAEKTKQAEQLAAAKQLAQARLQVMSTVVIAALLTTLVLTIYLYRSRNLQKRLQVLSDTDPLTGLLNRRAFLSQVEKLRQLAQRQRFALSVAVIDLDYFKKINDQHGHQVGDAVLRVFANATTATLRQTDVIGRFGGEEFILAATEQDNTAFAALLQRLQQCFSQMCLADSSIGFIVSFSAGIANLTLQNAAAMQEIEQAIRQADEQLYRAKSNGRQQVCTEGLCLKLVII